MSALAFAIMMAGSGDSKVTCTLELEFPSEAHASKAFDAVQSDNEGFVDARVDGCNLAAVVHAESLNSLLHTLDDFLACVSVAAKIITGRE